MTEWWEVTLLLLHAIHFTLVQLTTTDPGDLSLNGYMVAPREDTGTTLDGSASYVGSWENGTDIKLLCNKVRTCMHMYDVCMYVCTYTPYNRMSAMIIIYVETGLVEVKKIRGGAISSKVLAMDHVQ